jgi:hypothetical protein
MTSVPGWDRAPPVEEDGRLIGEPAPAARSIEANPQLAAPAVAAKIDWHSTPQVEVFTAADLERVRRETEARRWSDLLRTLRAVGLAGLALMLAGLGFELAQRLFNPGPSDAQLARAGAALGAQFLADYSTEAQPLAFATAEPRLAARDGATRAQFDFTITLRLREPLYAPADSNGAQAYLDLQRSVAEAQRRLVAARLFHRHPELGAPVTLPALLARTHREGERLTIRVPVAARRQLFGWKLEPDFAAAQVVTPGFVGEVLARQPSPHLIFNHADTRAQLRQLQAEARAYVLAVQRVLAPHRPVVGGR